MSLSTCYIPSYDCNGSYFVFPAMYFRQDVYEPASRSPHRGSVQEMRSALKRGNASAWATDTRPITVTHCTWKWDTKNAADDRKVRPEQSRTDKRGTAGALKSGMRDGKGRVGMAYENMEKEEQRGLK